MASCCANPDVCCDHHVPNAKADLTIALVGNPNCGKTTLFNALTGARQKVGNWPGVTVERKSGVFSQAGKTVEVIDLPGIYSLTMPSESAVDECIACQFVLGQKADVYVNIVDASHLERHLYLTVQLLEMGVPVILALNMMDVAQANGVQIDISKLSRQLGCPVVELQAHKGGGVNRLKEKAIEVCKVSDLVLDYPGEIVTAVEALTAVQVTGSRGQAAGRQIATTTSLGIRLLEGDGHAQSQVGQAVLAQVAIEQDKIQQVLGEDADILIAEMRYQFIQGVLLQCAVSVGRVTTSWTNRIDRLVLNRVLGIPVFLGVMYALFFFAIIVGGVFQDFFDLSSQAIFVDGFAALLSQWGLPGWLTAVLANGIGKGINTTITFIPVIGSMFLFLAFLEGSGYMARAAFVVDRLMRAMGLPGKAFVPMIVGFGCNVPAVMAARNLENKRDRILTIMMSPFMSCGARLAIYAVFTAAFFPQGGQNVVFALYLIGIFMAVMTGFILRKTLLKGYPSALTMELPAYHMPRIKTLLLHAWQRLKAFVIRAGRLILPICVLIGALNALNVDGTINLGEGDAQSFLSVIGQWATPVFSPMGVQASNWPATVGLLTGVLAKEVVVGTLNTLYSQAAHLASMGAGDFHLWASLQQAVNTIPENLAALGAAFINPISAKAPIQEVSQGVYGVMYQQFDGRIGAFAYLLFILLYFPCVSTMAAMLRELHRGWAIFSAAWTTGVAYAVAVVFYQLATITRHPLSSSIWVASLVSAFGLTIWLMHFLTRPRSQAPHLGLTDLEVAQDELA